MVNCPYCGKLTDPKLDGCPHCGGYLRKKQLKPAAPPKSSQTCPSCQAVVQRGDIICVVCGTNLLTGQKVADAASPSKGGGDGIPLGIVLTGVIAAAAIVFIALLTFVGTSDPVDRARELIAEYQYPEAEELLTAYVEENPDDDEAWFELAKLYWRSKQYGDAASSFQTVVDINPANDEAGLLGVLSMKLSSETVSIDQEINLLRKVAKSAPANPQVQYLLAMALGVRGDDGDAEEQIAALERVLNLQPDADFARLDLAVSQILNGSTQDARYSLHRIEDDTLAGNVQATLGFLDAYENQIDQAVTNLEAALDAEYLAARAQTQIVLAQLLIQQGRFREAEELLRTALSQNAGNSHARYLRGVALHALNRANESLSEYQTVMLGDSDYTGRAAVQAANLQLLLGDAVSADRSIGIARRESVETPSFYTVSGRLKVASGDAFGALQDFNTALQMDPTYASAYLERGLYHVSQEQISEGVRDLNKYLELIGRNTVGTKANEVRMLTNQLQRTMVEGRG